ncbi:MAG: type I phosphomannose isomerase catalytic subunit [Candidatus Flemingiibacterium sp.]
MKNLYPLKLKPTVKEIIWGGDRLKTDYGKSAPFEKLAESWELTVRPDGMNVIENGECAGMTLGDYLAPELIGKGYSGDRFPLLIKFIDARDKLSIQVHPSDEYALKNEGEYGKTEMWYIVEAEEGAELVFGLNDGYSKEAFDRAVENGTVESLLRRVKVKPGDVYFIPSGLVHAIGAGILICEIQQNSNVTYRVYDYNRPGKDGKPRELHVAKAREVIIDYSPAQLETLRFSGRADLTPDLLATCDKFTVHKYEVSGELSLDVTEHSFVSLTFVSGDGEMIFGKDSYKFAKGDTYFLPAGLGEVKLSSESAVCIASEI